MYHQALRCPSEQQSDFTPSAPLEGSTKPLKRLISAYSLHSLIFLNSKIKQSFYLRTSQPQTFRNSRFVWILPKCQLSKSDLTAVPSKFVSDEEHKNKTVHVLVIYTKVEVKATGLRMKKKSVCNRFKHLKGP